MFEKELSTYHKNLPRLQEENPYGGYVVIQGDDILPWVWPDYIDALRNGERFFGNLQFMIKEITRKDSLIYGGYTNPQNERQNTYSDMELRRYCIDKAIEIFSWRKEFFLKEGSGPIDYAEVLYQYITTGEKNEFNLPGTRVPNTPTPKPVKPT